MPETSPSPRHASRRTVLKAAAWTTPVVAFAAQAPAVAASPANQIFGILFDGGSNIDGRLGNSYLNFGTTNSVGTITLTQPVVIRFDVVGLLAGSTAVRDFTAGASTGQLSRGAYVASTQTVPFTWTLPVGTVIPPVGPGTSVPDVLFSWRDGGQSGQLLTNKIVVRSISGGRIVSPGTLPLDSTVVKDYNQRAPSPNGIY